MTILPLQPEYPTETSDLSKWMGPRREQEPGAIDRLKPEDAEGVSGIYATRAEQAARVRRAAELIGMLWGVEYERANGMRVPMRQAGRQVLLECNGNLEELEELYRAMDKDPIWRDPCEKCQSPYSVAERMKAYRTKMQATKAKETNVARSWMDGMTNEEWAEEQAKNARIRAEYLATQKKAAAK